MRTLLAALAAALTAAVMVAVPPVAAAHDDHDHADDEVVPDVTLSVQSILLDPIRGGTQTVRVVADTPVPVRVWVDDYHYNTVWGTLTIQRDGKNCGSSGSVCSGSGDVTITYHAIDKSSANLYNEGKVIPVSVMAYTSHLDPLNEYIARAEGTTTLRYEFDAWVTWLPDTYYDSDPDSPQVVLRWRVEGPPLLGIGELRPTVTMRVKGLGSYLRIVATILDPAQCATEGSDIVCSLWYGNFSTFAFVLASCPTRDISISISTNFFDPNLGNNQVNIPSFAHKCAQTGWTGGSGGGSVGGSGSSSGAGSPSAGSTDDPSPFPASSSASGSSGAAASPTRSGATASPSAAAAASPDAGPGGPWAVIAGTLGALLLLSAAGGWWYWSRGIGRLASTRTTVGPASAPTTETSTDTSA